MWFQFDDLSTIEAKFFVVIEHCVHVLDPHGIDWAIEDNPFSVWGLRLSTIPNLNGKHTIRPFLRVYIENTVKLILRDTLWIDIVGKNIHEIRVILDLTHCLLESFDDARLATVG